MAKSVGAPRVYRRQDVERAVRIRHLLFADGLTLAGARRRLNQEAPAPSAEDELEAITGVQAAGSSGEPDVQLRAYVRRVRDELRDLHGLLASDPVVRLRPSVDRRNEPRQATFELGAESEPAPSVKRPRRRPSA